MKSAQRVRITSQMPDGSILAVRSSLVRKNYISTTQAFYNPAESRTGRNRVKQLDKTLRAKYGIKT